MNFWTDGNLKAYQQLAAFNLQYVKPHRIYCELCGHCYSMAKHHLRPAHDDQPRRGPTIWLCVLCHKAIHRLFTNRHLACALNTLEEIAATPVVVASIRNRTSELWKSSPHVSELDLEGSCEPRQLMVEMANYSF